MNTREQRAEKYLNKFERSSDFSPRHMEKAHIAGAQEEAVIKDCNKIWTIGEIARSINKEASLEELVKKSEEK